MGGWHLNDDGVTSRDELTPAEQDLLVATAGCPSYPPLVVSEINNASEKSTGNINVLLGRLVVAGK